LGPGRALADGVACVDGAVDDPARGVRVRVKRLVRLEHAGGGGGGYAGAARHGDQRVRGCGFHLMAGGDARDQGGDRRAERSGHSGPLLPVVAGAPCDCCWRRPGSPPPVTFWNRWRNCCCACTSEALGSTSTVSRSVRPLVTSM